MNAPLPTLRMRVDHYADDSGNHYVCTFDQGGYRVMLADALTAEKAAQLATALDALPYDLRAALVRNIGGAVGA